MMPRGHFSIRHWTRKCDLPPPVIIRAIAIPFHFQPLDRALWAGCRGEGPKPPQNSDFCCFFEFFEPWARHFSLNQLFLGTMCLPNTILKWQKRPRVHPRKKYLCHGVELTWPIHRSQGNVWGTCAFLCAQ